MNKLFVRYSKDILLTSNFNVDKWSLTLTHSQGSKTVDGSGPNIGGNANAANLLRMAKAGNVITISSGFSLKATSNMLINLGMVPPTIKFSLP